MQCPKCGSGVPDGSTQCHICFAPIDAGAPKGPVGLQTPEVRQDVPDEVEPGIPGITRPGGVSSQPLGGLAEPRPNYLSPSAEPVPNYMAPGAGAAPPMGGGQVRTSLTGEVFEGPPAPAAAPVGYPPPGPPPPGYAPGRPAPPMPPPGQAPRPGGPMPVQPVRASGGRPGPYRPAPSGSGGGKGLLIVILLLLVIGGGGAGGWWWYNNRTNPKDQALAAYKAIASSDWKAAYPLVALSDADKAKTPDADSFSREVQSELNTQPGAAMGLQMLRSLTDISVGEPSVDQNHADVPTSAKLSLAGTTIPLNGTAHMVKEAGIWKLDATQGSSAAPKLLADLVGFDSLMAKMGMGKSRGASPRGGGSGRSRRGRR